MIARRLPFPARHMIRLCLIAGGLLSASFSSLADTIPGSVIDPAIDAYLLNMVDEEHLSGVVLVTRGGDIVHAKGYGTAAGDSPNTVDTAFHIASVSKQFTAAAVLQLVERGKVDLDRSINTYLPERYRTPGWDSVTVHHLLSHSGGVPDYAVTRDY